MKKQGMKEGTKKNKKNTSLQKLPIRWVMNDCSCSNHFKADDISGDDNNNNDGSDYDWVDFSYPDEEETGRQYSCVVDTTGEVGSEGCVNAPITSNYLIDFKVYLRNNTKSSIKTTLKVMIVNNKNPVMIKNISVPSGTSTVYLDGNVHLKKGDSLWIDPKSSNIDVLKIRGGISTIKS